MKRRSAKRPLCRFSRRGSRCFRSQRQRGSTSRRYPPDLSEDRQIPAANWQKTSYLGSARALACPVRRLAERNLIRKRVSGGGAENSTRGACAPQTKRIRVHANCLKNRRSFWLK